MIGQLVDDPIPNIRFNVAKSYEQLISVLRQLPEQGTIAALKADGNDNALPGPTPLGLELIQKQIIPNLQKLQNDDDVDVRYFASTAALKAADLMAP